MTSRSSSQGQGHRSKQGRDAYSRNVKLPSAEPAQVWVRPSQRLQLMRPTQNIRSNKQPTSILLPTSFSFHLFSASIAVVNIAVLVGLMVSAILVENWPRYRRYFSYAVSIWVWRYFFTYFLAIFDTNTFVVKCTSSVCQQQHYCAWRSNK